MELLPFVPQDDTIITLLVLSIALGVYFLSFKRKLNLWITTVLASSVAGLCTFLYWGNIQQTYERFDVPYLQTAYFAIIFLAYYIVHYLLAVFTHWVFFDKKKLLQFNSVLTRATYLETLTFLIALLSITFQWHDATESVILSLILVIFVKLWYVAKVRKLFFNKIVACIHFFAYLCAIEMVPLLVLVGFLIGKDFVL